MNPEYGTTTARSNGNGANGADEENGDERSASTRRLNDGDEHDDATDGSSIFGAVCNFTKTIVNAGITGLGGAFAISGGCVSIVGIIFCALLSKLSFDLLIYLCIVVNESSTSSSMTTISTKGRIASSSYEELGAAAFGGPGCAIVVISKTLYLFGTMVVYHMVVKENFASAVNNLLPTSLSSSSSWWGQLLQSENAMMVAVGTIVILPLSLLRDLKPLEKSSIFGMIAVTSLVSIVIYLYFTTTPTNTSRSNDGTAAPDDEPSVLYVHWFQVRGGVLQSLGTFISTFIAHATVHMAYDSIRPDIRNYKTWKLVSSISLVFSTFLALLAGIFVYMTFWLDATSSMFALYPPSSAIDFGKILKTATIALTFPLFMVASREIIILSLISIPVHHPLAEETLELLSHHRIKRPWLLPGRDRQLTRNYHVLLTTSIWFVTIIVALAAPSLGDVLNLVGCATGTVIAFILPAVFSFKIIGYNRAGAFIFLFGIPMGVIGTYFSFPQLVQDTKGATHD